MIDPTALQQMEESSTQVLLKLLIPMWIILSIAVTVWSYRSTRAKVFWKNLYKSIFPPKSGTVKEQKRWFRR